MYTTTDVIIYFIKLFATTLFVVYSFKKLSYLDNLNLKEIVLVVIFGIVLSFGCTYVKFKLNAFLAVLILCFLQGIMLSITCNKKVGQTIMFTTISYAICAICQVISVIVTFIPYRLLRIHNDYINLIMILIIQFVLLYLTLKIKRVYKSFIYLHERLDNEFADTIMMNTSVSIIIITCFIGALTEDIDTMSMYVFVLFVILVVAMVTLIQKTLKMYYKQKLMTDTINNYEKQINDQNLKIEKLSNEKYKISEVLHKFYNRQEALEMAVNDEKLKKNIHCLTEEFSKEISVIKGLDEIPKADILEIDNMFKYMQNECYLNKIGFNLSIDGNIHYLVNNIIAKEKLETLIGDHLRDAINAVNKVNIDNKEIFAILGVKDGKYELCILDTGVDFDIDTILKLGKQRVTTCDNGNGIGFMTTFETMKETKASLIITENAPNEDRYYTKSVTIRFDNKFKYIVNTYRAKEMKTLCKREDIIINKI